jgi:hypothetical protein
MLLLKKITLNTLTRTILIYNPPETVAAFLARPTLTIKRSALHKRPTQSRKKSVCTLLRKFLKQLKKP